jgi:xanthine dehydrogenase iron-sulfur cluster and FAD-binding subunit A
LRAGFATSIKYKAGAGARQTLIGKLADLRSNERMVLEALYPNEGFEQIADKILKSRQAFTTESGAISGSQTAFTQQAVKRQGNAGNLADMADIVGSTMTGNVTAATLSAGRVIKRSLGKQAEALTEDQIERIARILVTEDPSVFEAAINNVEGREKLVARILKLTRMVAGGTGSLAIVASDEAVGDTVANMISSATADESPALQSLVQSTSPNVAQRIQQSAR